MLCFPPAVLRRVLTIVDGGHDAEKGTANLKRVTEDIPPAQSDEADEASANTFRQRWRAVGRFLIRYNLEARGVERVMPEQRHDMRQLGYLQVGLFWISINLTALIVTLGML